MHFQVPLDRWGVRLFQISGPLYLKLFLSTQIYIGRFKKLKPSAHVVSIVLLLLKKIVGLSFDITIVNSLHKSRLITLFYICRKMLPVGPSSTLLSLFNSGGRLNMVLAALACILFVLSINKAGEQFLFPRQR